jgi:hypothetical protein
MPAAGARVQIATSQVYRHLGDFRFCREVTLEADVAALGRRDPSWVQSEWLGSDATYAGPCDEAPGQPQPIPVGLLLGPTGTVYWSDGTGALCWYSNPAHFEASDHAGERPGAALKALPAQAFETRPCPDGR